MQIFIPFLLVVLGLFSPGVTQGQPADGSQPASGTVVKGDVLLLEGEYVVMKEMSGREVRVHVNSDTKIEGVAGKLKVGDKIQAKVNSDGHATSIALDIPDSSTPPPPIRPMP
ncbi:MAG TPA: hypothetical protein VH681_06150 [Nitrospiraceae bacterium]|jgi:hypothetical protein